MKKFSSPSQKIGELGERIACIYLQNKGFFIRERNYTKKWGEIDIIALKQGVIHFIEVKSISGDRERSLYRPEEQMHERKYKRMKRTVDTYLLENPQDAFRDLQCDLVCVYLNSKQKQAQVSLFENSIFF